jgi:hypothetical protein
MRNGKPEIESELWVSLLFYEFSPYNPRTSYVESR